jgi:hypothetical protein
MGIAQRIMFVIAAALVVGGGFMSTRHVYDGGIDCGTAFAQHETDNGMTEASLFGAPAGTTVDCRAAVRDARGVAGGIAAIGVLIAGAAALSSITIGSGGPSRERETLRLNG